MPIMYNGDCIRYWYLDAYGTRICISSTWSKDGVDAATEKYKEQPRIKMINKNVSFESHNHILHLK